MQDILTLLGITDTNKGTSTGSQWLASTGQTITSSSPVDGQLIANVVLTDEAGYEAVMQKASEAFLEWRMWPSPKAW